jgi:hypothetical protein
MGGFSGWGCNMSEGTRGKQRGSMEMYLRPLTEHPSLERILPTGGQETLKKTYQDVWLAGLAKLEQVASATGSVELRQLSNLLKVIERDPGLAVLIRAPSEAERARAERQANFYEELSKNTSLPDNTTDKGRARIRQKQRAKKRVRPD